MGINAAEGEKIGERDGAERGEDGLGMEQGRRARMERGRGGWGRNGVDGSEDWAQ